MMHRGSSSSSEEERREVVSGASMGRLCGVGGAAPRPSQTDYLAAATALDPRPARGVPAARAPGDVAAVGGVKASWDAVSWVDLTALAGSVGLKSRPASAVTFCGGAPTRRPRAAGEDEEQ